MKLVSIVSLFLLACAPCLTLRVSQGVARPRHAGSGVATRPRMRLHARSGEEDSVQRRLMEELGEGDSACETCASPEPPPRMRNAALALASAALSVGLFAFQRTNPVSPISLLHKMEAESPALYAALENGKPTVIDCYADWCENCAAMAPATRQLEREYGRSVNWVTIRGDARTAEAQVSFGALARPSRKGGGGPQGWSRLRPRLSVGSDNADRPPSHDARCPPGSINRPWCARLGSTRFRTSLSSRRMARCRLPSSALCRHACCAKRCGPSQSAGRCRIAWSTCTTGFRPIGCRTISRGHAMQPGKVCSAADQEREAS